MLRGGAASGRRAGQRSSSGVRSALAMASRCRCGAGSRHRVPAGRAGAGVGAGTRRAGRRGVRRGLACGRRRDRRCPRARSAPAPRRPRAAACCALSSASASGLQIVGSAAARRPPAAARSASMRSASAATRAANSPVLVGTVARARCTRTQRFCSSSSARIELAQRALLLVAARLEGRVQPPVQHALDQAQLVGRLVALQARRQRRDQLLHARDARPLLALLGGSRVPPHRCRSRSH